MCGSEGDSHAERCLVNAPQQDAERRHRLTRPYRDERGDLAVQFLSDARHFAEFLDGSVGASLGTPGHDPLGKGRADAWQFVQIGDRGAVEVKRPSATPNGSRGGGREGGDVSDTRDVDMRGVGEGLG